MSAEAPGSASDRFFEDYVPGRVEELGVVTVDADEIVEFARRFDPQDFHLDPAGAQDGPFGGLVASGWHTAGLMTKLFVTRFLCGASSLGSPGIDELRWPAPVRPGDSLSVLATVVEARPSRSRPDRGFIRTFVEVRNQRGEAVMTMSVMNLIRRREKG